MPSNHQPELSIVVPALNEQDNVAPLVEQVHKAIILAGIDAELIVVDDGSTDATLERLTQLTQHHAWIKVLHHARPLGQSAAMHTGIQHANGRYVATLDADLQNDPQDLPMMLAKLRAGEADMIQGNRSHARRDNTLRRCSSWVGRTTRKCLLGDTIRDTGCTTRVIDARYARQVPLMFKGMHRFIPVYVRMLGGRVIEIPVNHRPRVAGVAKYGVMNRAFAGLVDCLAVRWMLKRFRTTQIAVIDQRTIA